MTSQPPPPKPRSLEELSREAKDFTPAEPDWDHIDAKLFARIDAHDEAARARPRLGRRGWGAIAGALAVAAAAMVFVGKRDVVPVDGPQAVTRDPGAGSLSAVEGAGRVMVGGQAVTEGRGLVRGDVVEAEGARGVFDRPGKVTFSVEDQSRLRVDHTSGPIIVALEKGAVEADVVPVARGEAFGVDVATASDRVRIAVHGTHLRVARDGSRVTVDLTEGVVSIGRPPRDGSTYGTLVVAPAHVEFDAANLGAGVTVDHANEHVRRAVVLRPHKVAALGPAHVDDHEPAPTGGAAAGHVGSPAIQSPGVPVVDGRHPTPGGSSEPSTAGTESVGGTVPPAASAPKIDVKPKDHVIQAVRSCVASRVQLGQQGVRITVSSMLHLKVGADGHVESARFDPPLDPEVQTCAAATIYATRFPDAGAVKIAIEVGR